ncbi:glycosyltransferase [Azospirillum sp.]|uniref:glycosyltransferase n=1 Tax=Azospirillum sp. TaxID=34012 RepID=UPI002D39D897|nr:glycosyltransferase [Azospirillum sp.]HYD68482.1 glycosyltransferase [Azospirillum sp.]
MRLLVLGSLNPNLIRAKLEPLLACGWVERVVWLGRQAGPELPKVAYETVPDEPAPIRRSLHYLLRALAAARRERPDLILAYNLVPFGLYARLCAWTIGRPYAVAVIGGPREVERGGGRLDNRLLTRWPLVGRALAPLLPGVLRGARFVTTTGTATRDALVAAGVPGERIVPLPSAVDPARFHPSPRPARWDVLTLARLIRRKRLDRLLDVVERLRARHPALRVAVAGDGPLRAELAAEVARRGLGDAVDLLGWRDDVRPLLWESRVMVLTSAAEGLPLSMIEAMGCGVPCVAPAVGDSADLVQDGVNGRLVPPDDDAALADAVDALLRDEAARARMAAAAADTVRAGFTTAHATQRWEAIRARFL